MEQVQVVIVDDHVMVREGIKQLFSELARELHAKKQNKFTPVPGLEENNQEGKCKC